MSSFDQLEQAASFIADMRNGEVVAKAFKEASIFCPHCNFPKNADTFFTWLNFYIDARREMHRAKRKLEDSWGYYESRWTPTDVLEARFANASKLAHNWRLNLANIWPCEACRKAYNPTWKLSIPVSPHTPIQKGILDV